MQYFVTCLLWLKSGKSQDGKLKRAAVQRSESQTQSLNSRQHCDRVRRVDSVLALGQDWRCANWEFWREHRRRSQRQACVGSQRERMYSRIRRMAPELWAGLAYILQVGGRLSPAAPPCLWRWGRGWAGLLWALLLGARPHAAEELLLDSWRKKNKTKQANQEFD